MHYRQALHLKREFRMKEKPPGTHGGRAEEDVTYMEKWQRGRRRRTAGRAQAVDRVGR